MWALSVSGAGASGPGFFLLPAGDQPALPAIAATALLFALMGGVSVDRFGTRRGLLVLAMGALAFIALTAFLFHLLTVGG